MTQLEQKQDELINLLFNQIGQIKVATQGRDEVIQELWTVLIDLTLTSKIELGDDVIAEVKRLRDDIIKETA